MANWSGPPRCTSASVRRSSLSVFPLFLPIRCLVVASTVVLVMITAVLGVGLLRIQGLATLTRGMSRLQGGELPATEVVEGLLLAVAGALLLTPGFITDGVGFILLTPPLRALVAQRVLSRVQIVEPMAGGGFRPMSSRGDGVIEGEFEPVRDSDEPEIPPESR